MSGQVGAGSSLPIDAALPELLERLRAGPNAVLEAPPGAGKTTRVPLALLDQPWRGDGRILLLEPRRVAARAAAARLAANLGEEVGRTVGYRIRHESRVSAQTRIEVLTEGVLTRRLQSDPSLEGVAAVLFDEFHERSIHADLGLALCLEAQGALREDLRLVAMSATLDGAAVSALMQAPRVRSEGRSYPVETRWLEQPLKSGSRDFRFEREVADLIRRALSETTGDALAFLPGAAEIRRCAADLERDPPADSPLILPLYGELPFAEQQKALAPDPEGRRKVVLSTALAETSLTIDGVRVVIDGGRARRARFDPDAGMSRLVTTRVSKASAEQRRGRAGRTAPGWCYRLWTGAEEGGAPERDPPEIRDADLAGLALDLAAWGAQPEDLPFLDPPPETALAQARALLGMLGALDAAGRITEHGRRLAATPLHPRLAHMAILSGGDDKALRLAALLEERDPLRGAGADLTDRMNALDRPERRPEARPALMRIRDAAKRLKKRVRLEPGERAEAPATLGGLTALAFPDRLATRRGEGPRYHLSGGKGAKLPEGDPLTAEPYLAVAELGHGPRDRTGAEATIRLAAPIARAEIETLFEDRLVWRESCVWSRRDRQALARRRLHLFETVLEEQPWPSPPQEAFVEAMTQGVRELGIGALPWTPAARRLQARIARARSIGGRGEALPDSSDAALLDDLESWLSPHLSGMRRQADLDKLPLERLLVERLDWGQSQLLDELAPSHFRAPTGTRAPIDYGADEDQAPPRIAIKLQEMFGVTRHPTVLGEPLLIDLLSPAGRPLQTTADIPGFWGGAYVEVAKEMRARYPRHPWPEDPAAAEATRRAKPRRS